MRSKEPLEKTSYYKPYESALVIFKDYRYHPDYLNNVRGGYKSMTYSHRIHIEKMLCPFEAAGGKCNDKGCEHQHFQNMGLTGSCFDFFSCGLHALKLVSFLLSFPIVLPLPRSLMYCGS